MGRMVIAPLNSLTIGSDATQDLWSLMAGAGNRIALHGWEITSDAIAATLLELTLQGVTGHGTVGGGTVTEVNLDDDNSTTITGSVEWGRTTPGTPGGIGVLAGYQWEQLGPLGHIYTPEMRPKINVSQGIALTCNTAAAFEMSGWICWEEL